MRTRTLRRLAVAAASALLVLAPSVAPASATRADSYVPVSGAGSTWSENALDQWIRDVQQYGMRINYAGTGSSDGRRQFLNGTVDFAASDIPFQSHPEDGSAPENPAKGSYAYMPITAGGTVFMYNLVINGQRVTNLRLSGQNIAKIFTHAITNWDDPALAKDNPGLRLPNKPIVPVVRSDGSGSTFELTEWMISQYRSVWNGFCASAGRSACGPTSYYPTVSGMIAQAGDLGVSGYVAQNYADGAIGYVNYSYALNAKFPVIKMLNAAGYYTEPTPQNVAVSLLKAEVDTKDTDPSLYLTQKLDGVYTNNDPRNYPLSSYAYLIIPTKVQGQFTAAKGKTLAAFSYFTMCQGQQESASLGYSPMPVNLVQASFNQIAKIPGAVVKDINIQSCHNPTFSSTGVNLLAKTAPMPAACDHQGATQCATGTGGASKTPTVVVTGGGSGTGNGSGSGNGTGTGTGGGTSPVGGGSSGSGLGRSSTGSGASTAGAANAAGTGSSTDGTSSGSSTGAADPSSCDPSTADCGGGSGTSPSAGTDPTAQPDVLAASHGWTGTQTLMVLIALALLAVVIGPGLVARRIDRGRP